MATEQPGRALGLPLAVVVAWVAMSAPFSVTASVWGLAALSACAAVARWFIPEHSTFAVRRRVVDILILAFFAVSFAFLAATARLG